MTTELPTLPARLDAHIRMRESRGASPAELTLLRDLRAVALRDDIQPAAVVRFVLLSHFLIAERELTDLRDAAQSYKPDVVEALNVGINTVRQQYAAARAHDFQAGESLQMSERPDPATLHHLAVEATRTDSTAKDVRASRDALVEACLRLGTPWTS